MSTNRVSSLARGAARRLEKQRKSLGLPQDQGSQDLWMKRFNAGTHTEEDAIKALTKKSNAWGENRAYQSGTSSYAPQTNKRTPLEVQDTMQSAEVVGDNFGQDSSSNQFNFAPESHYSQDRVYATQQMVLDNMLSQEQRQQAFNQAAEQYGQIQGQTAADFWNLPPDVQAANARQFATGMLDQSQMAGQRYDHAAGTIGGNAVSSRGFSGGVSAAGGVGAYGQVTDGKGGYVPGTGNPPDGAGGQQSGEFGFDPQFNEQMNNINAQRAQLQSEEELQRRRMAEDAQRAEQEGRELRDDNLTANTERMADSGMVHSGINIQAQADIGENYMKYNDQIQQARSRGEEDLARWLTGQRNDLMAQEGIARQERAAREAAERELKDMQDAIANTPVPSVAGRYELNIPIADEARQLATQGQYGSDAKYFDDPNRLAHRIEAIFDNDNVSLVGHGNETDFQRLARIVQEVASGQRTMDDVRNSSERLARIQNI